MGSAPILQITTSVLFSSVILTSSWWLVSHGDWVHGNACIYQWLLGTFIKSLSDVHLFCVGLNEVRVLIWSPKDNIQVSGLTYTTWWLWGIELRLTSALVAFPGGPPHWCVFVVRITLLVFLLSSGVVFQFGYWVLTNIPSPKSPVPFLSFPTMPLQHIFRCWKFQFPARPVHLLICFISKHTDHSFGVAIAVQLPARW